jgi:hypothetical protein
MTIPCRYVAARRFRMCEGVYREAGQPVPEADTWAHPKLHIEAGDIRLAKAEDFPDLELPPETSAAAQPAVEARSADDKRSSRQGSKKQRALNGLTP